MVEDLGDSNRPNYAIPYHKSYQIPNISTGHKSVIFQARSPKFYMVLDLDNTNRLYIPCHDMLYHNIFEVKGHFRWGI